MRAAAPASHWRSSAATSCRAPSRAWRLVHHSWCTTSSSTTAPKVTAASPNHHNARPSHLMAGTIGDGSSDHQGSAADQLGDRVDQQSGQGTHHGAVDPDELQVASDIRLDLAGGLLG